MIWDYKVNDQTLFFLFVPHSSDYIRSTYFHYRMSMYWWIYPTLGSYSYHFSNLRTKLTPRSHLLPTQLRLHLYTVVVLYYITHKMVSTFTPFLHILYLLFACVLSVYIKFVRMVYSWVLYLSVKFLMSSCHFLVLVFVLDF